MTRALTFSKWLRGSNEAAPFRQAFKINDEMPIDFQLRSSCFHAIQMQCEAAWAETKAELSQ